MKRIFQVGIILCCTLLNCDPEGHEPSDHPCNFPDIWTEVNLLSPFSYKIIDKITSVNLVDTVENSIIHADSVVLMDENFSDLPFRNNQPRAFRYYIDNWIFDNLFPYNGMPGPWDDPQAYLNLKNRTFYLRVAYNDIDTIQIQFEQCLLKPPVLFNGLETEQPINESYEGYTSFYFRK